MTNSPRPSSVRFKVLGFLCVLSFLTYYDRFSMVRAQDDIARTLGLSNEQIGLLLNAFFLAYSVFEIPGGWLGDRFGPRLALARIVLAWSLFTALTGSATGFTTLLICRFCFGMGEAGAYPNIARVQSAWLPLKARGWASGLIWMSGRWGGALAPILFGSISRMFESETWKNAAGTIGLPQLGEVASWRLSFWVAGLMGLAWVAAFYPWFRNSPMEKPAVNEAELALIRAEGGGVPLKHEHMPEMWRLLLTSGSVWAISLQYFFASCGWSFYVTWIQKYMKDVHQMTYQQSELITALPLLLGGVSCLLGGLTSDLLIRRRGWGRFGRAIFPVTGFSVAALATFTIPWVTTPQQAIACMCIANFFFDFGQGANWASIVTIGGRYAGTASGFLNTWSNLAGAVAPWLAARIFGTVGWGVLFALYGSAYLVAASMWLFIDPTRRFYEGRLGKEAAAASN